MRYSREVLKRGFDVLASVLALTLLSPLLMLIAIFVWFDSGNPILFKQERVGRNFRCFRIWKFRTMHPGTCGPIVTIRGDARITRLGRVLRATKLDELPQFWNVLRGEMSIVGPRPEMAKYVSLYFERYKEVLRVRPGITDLASLRYQDEESLLAGSQEPLKCYVDSLLPVKLDLAEEYLRKRSFHFDAWILLRTALLLLGIKDH